MNYYININAPWNNVQSLGVKEKSGKISKAFNSKTQKYITNKKLEFYETFFAITHTNNSIKVV